MTHKNTHKNTIDAILDSLAQQKQKGETPLVVKLEPGLIPEVMKALEGYRPVFAPVVPGVTDTVPMAEKYREIRQANAGTQTVLIFVECETLQAFRDAIGEMPIRHSSEWRSRPGVESGSPD